MQIVIDIPEDLYVKIKRQGYIHTVYADKVGKIISNGTPLPKCHGRLIDADERRREIDEEYRWVVDLAPTVIKADKN